MTATEPTVYGEGYYLRAEGSNYTNYVWKPELTIPMCKRIVEYLGIRPGESLLDIGCARAFATLAFRMVGVKAIGFDSSEWAIENCHPESAEWVTTTLPKRAFDWAYGKDVFEHIQSDELARLVEHLNATITKGMFFIVPLAEETGGAYIRPEDEVDRTHVLRWTLEDWIAFLECHAPGFNVNASYNIHGIKPAAAKVHHSCGFFTLIRP
jgi:hypothetical protein